MQDTPLPTGDPNLLLDLVSMKMPYGKYKGYTLCDIPEYYLVWMHARAFPKGN